MWLDFTKFSSYQGVPLIMKIDTTKTRSNSSNSDQFEISDSKNMIPDVEFKFRIDWGDGTESIVVSKSDLALKHTYASSGVKIVKIYPLYAHSKYIVYYAYRGVDVDPIPDGSKIIEIQQFGFAGLSTLARCENLEKVYGIPAFVTNAFGASANTYLFRQCSALTYVENLSDIYTLMRAVPSITSMINWMSDCSSFAQDISFNLSGIVSIGRLLYNTKIVNVALTNCGDLTVDTDNQFRNMPDLESITLGGWKLKIDIKESTKMTTVAYLALIDSIADLTSLPAGGLTVKNHAAWTAACDTAASNKNWNVTKI